MIWDYDAFAFVQGQAPATVNPSLWRQALLNNQIGLFKVRDGIWQLRGFDLANITLIEGQTGWIVVDTPQPARDRRRGHGLRAPAPRRQAGIGGDLHAQPCGRTSAARSAIMSADEAKARSVPVVAPAGFMEEATSENLMMGVAMARRVDVHVRQPPAAPMRRPGRHRPRQGAWPTGAWASWRRPWWSTSRRRN